MLSILGQHLNTLFSSNITIQGTGVGGAGVNASQSSTDSCGTSVNIIIPTSNMVLGLGHPTDECLWPVPFCLMIIYSSFWHSCPFCVLVEFYY